MGTFALRRGIRRSPLRWRRTSLTQLNRSAAAGRAEFESTPAAAAPALEWPGKETRSEAEEWNEDRLKVLLPRLARRRSRTPQVRRRGSSLPAAHLCRLRSRLSGRARLPQLHALAHAYVGPHEVATIYLRLFEPGSLADADPRRIREMFRKRLDRAGFKDAIVVGGIEVAWQEKWQRWLLHAHVLAIGVDAVAWKQLEAALEDSGTAEPVDAETAARPRRAALLLHQVR